MLILMHVLIAISSIVLTTYAYITPSRAKLASSIGLIILTLASGTYLVMSLDAPLLHTCLTGLAYTAVVITGVFAASKKLAYDSHP